MIDYKVSSSSSLSLIVIDHDYHSLPLSPPLLSSRPVFRLSPSHTSNRPDSTRICFALAPHHTSFQRSPHHGPALIRFSARKQMPPPVVTLTTPQSPTRARSVSQPIREDIATDFTYPAHTHHEPRSSILRSHSSNSVIRATTSSINTSASSPNMARSAGRARSSSLVAVTEVGGDEPENVVDRLGVGSNENAAWVNAPG